MEIQDDVLEQLDEVDLLNLKDIENEFNVCIKVPDDERLEPVK